MWGGANEAEFAALFDEVVEEFRAAGDFIPAGGDGKWSSDRSSSGQNTAGGAQTSRRITTILCKPREPFFEPTSESSHESDGLEGAPVHVWLWYESDNGTNRTAVW